MTGKNALLSVYDKTGIVKYAQALIDLGWTIYASGGTARVLRQAEVPVIDIETLVGGPILGHRVVTLSREIHAALLAQHTAEDVAELINIGVPFIDLVYVDLYPLAEEIAKADATLDSVTEKTDIGGPAMLRSAAKGRRIVINGRAQAEEVLEWLREGQPDSARYRRHLAAEAEATAADYALASARYLSEGEVDGTIGHRVEICEYGENPWQQDAALYSSDTGDPLGLLKFARVSGRPPSYNGLKEILFRQLQTMTHIAAGFNVNFGSVPPIAIGTKHGNACGAAVGDTEEDAIKAMIMGDPIAIFGGLIMVNFVITEPLAQLLLHYGMDQGRRLLDAITAPAFTNGAVEMLERSRGKCRLLANPALAHLTADSLDQSPMMSTLRGGWLKQPNYTFIWDMNDPDLVVTGALSNQQARDAILAWAICATSNSNTITLVRDGQLLGNGVGQQSRVACCELAIARAMGAGHEVGRAVAASDSFFPFADGPTTLAMAGVAVILATSGSVRDAEVREACAHRSVTLVQLPDAKARGFLH